MDNLADIIIVGAGIQGASLAFHLSQRGVNPLVLEKNFVASGATGRSSGLVRMYYDSEIDSQLAWSSFSYFRNWSEVVGGDCGFLSTGFLYIEDQERGNRLIKKVGAQQRMGIPTLLITSDDVRRLAPMFRTDDFELAAYEPDSGYADPPATAKSLMEAARRQGARLIQDCRVTGILTEGERVKGVETSRGTYSSPVVVNAAGPWAPEISRMVGLELPIKTMRHDVMIVRRPLTLGPAHPVVIDEPYQQYFRPETGKLSLVGLDDVNTLGESPDGPTDYVKPGYIQQAIDRICLRIPGMESASLQGSYCGYEGMTVDGMAILDQAGPEGFYLDCGFSGTGFKTAPAVGKAMAQIILDGDPGEIDLSPFSWHRFADGKLERMLENERAFTVI
jgi:sarcosine oxidase subunit beta